MKDRFHPRSLDPLDGAVGDGIVIGSDGQFTVGPVSATPPDGTYVLADGLTTLSSNGIGSATPQEGDLRYNPAVSATAGGGGTSATTALVPLTTVVGGVPELVWEADNSLSLTEVPL